ncbi:cysteine hydrolase [Flavisphingomonas formosensis]|uniref:cysteine hydrolase n=1 Tax=Flavisphingomonas formosensis TaxID=861534 RepID=UPI0012F8EE95|nr:cysteine hydrolase [Sphingomonas formosensis]
MAKAKLKGIDRGERLALVTSECQSAIVDPAIAMFKGLAEDVEQRGVLPRIAGLAALCRAAAIPVVHCTVRLLPDAYAFPACSPLQAIMKRNPLLRRDRPESWLHRALGADPADIVSDRMHGITAFHGTELESILRGLGVETLLLTGVSTNIALIGTAIEAVNRGFSVVIPADCVAGGTPETHRHSLEYTLPILATVTDVECLVPFLVGRRRI